MSGCGHSRAHSRAPVVGDRPEPIARDPRETAWCRAPHDRCIGGAPVESFTVVMATGIVAVAAREDEHPVGWVTGVLAYLVIALLVVARVPAARMAPALLTPNMSVLMGAATQFSAADAPRSPLKDLVTGSASDAPSACTPPGCRSNSAAVISQAQHV
jgi:hypothetical protein